MSTEQTFAQRVAELERALNRMPYLAFQTASLPELLLALREQQAALQKLVHIFDDPHSPSIAEARAVLAKWRIE